MATNAEKIQELRKAVEAGTLMPVEAIIYAVRLCMVQMTAGGGAAKGGAIGPQAQQVESYLRVFLSMRASLGVFARDAVEKFLKELPDLYHLSETKTPPKELKKLFEAFDLPWPLKEEPEVSPAQNVKITTVTLVGHLPARKVPIKSVINKPLPPHDREETAK